MTARIRARTPARTAATVTASSPAAQLAAMLSRFPPAVAARAKRCMATIARALPGCDRLVYDYPHSVVIAFGVSERGSEAVLALAVLDDGVRLYLPTTIPDPKRLLEGTGSKVRSLTLASAADLAKPAVRALLRAAIALAPKQATAGRAGKVVIKAGAKAKRAKKAGKKVSSRTARKSGPARATA
jgi:hypothetical protein